MKPGDIKVGQTYCGPNGVAGPTREVVRISGGTALYGPEVTYSMSGKQRCCDINTFARWAHGVVLTSEGSWQ